jgi:3',5'-nucleoside bisphosphate phosphatase
MASGYNKILMQIDLHTHTTASDGTYTPTELLHAAQKAGIETLAITDHDTVAAYDESIPVAEALGIRLIRGVEISADGPPGKCHLLALGIDPTHEEFNTTLISLSQKRRERNLLMVTRLNQLTGLDLTIGDIEAHAPRGANIGRPHFAACLVAQGVVPDIKTAFQKYLADGKPGQLEKESLTPADAIALTHRAGGKCFVAHPGLLRLKSHETFETQVKAYKELGIDGIEAYYSSYTPAEEAKFLRLAQKFNLLVTGGSDFHGANKPDIKIGGIRNGRPLEASLLNWL